jgi:glycosyltransferase involved in cell wall biosynthesis
VGELDRSIVDDVVVVDDCSRDDTVAVAERLGLHVYRHETNKGYGGNQKTCYAKAQALSADIVVMLHPDYQYTPKLVPAIVAVLDSGLYDVVLASRILGGQALAGGMPLVKYVANRVLTFVQNLATGMKLSEYHTGYRAFSRPVLERLPLDRNSDDFIFDNEMLMQVHRAGFRVAEVTCPTKYFDDASSIDFRRSCIYGLGCLWNSALFVLAKWNLYVAPFLDIAPARASQTLSPS